MTMITHASGQYPKALQGTIVFAAGGTGNYAVGETITGSGFSAKVSKWVAATNTLTVKNVDGTPSGLLTGGTSSAAWTVDTVNSTTVGGLSVKTGGWNLRETNHGIVRTKAVGARGYIAEVMFAQAKMGTVRTDTAVLPTFTLTGGAWSAATTYDVSLGDIATFTIVSSEAVKFGGTVTFPITVTGIGAKTATFRSSTANGLTHTFSYPVVTADIGGTGFSVAAGNFTKTNGSIGDIAGESIQGLSGAVAVGGTLADKTGVTIQA